MRVLGAPRSIFTHTVGFGIEKGTYELKLFVYHLAVDSIRSVPNPSVWHFNLYLLFQEHWFYKKPDLATFNFIQ